MELKRNEKYIDQIEQLHPDLISEFFATNHSDEIPKELQLFLCQLQWALEIYQTERNISRAARLLAQRIAAIQHVKIETRTCIERIYEAINYFSVDNNVPIRVWEDLYANQFEDLAKMCAAAGDYKTQSKCYERALDCRRRASEISEASRDLGLRIMYSPELTPDLLGFSQQSLKDIAKKSNEGFYLNLLADLPLERADRKRLMRDLDIEEAELIESS